MFAVKGSLKFQWHWVCFYLGMDGLKSCSTLMNIYVEGTCPLPSHTSPLPTQHCCGSVMIMMAICSIQSQETICNHYLIKSNSYNINFYKCKSCGQVFVSYSCTYLTATVYNCKQRTLPENIRDIVLDLQVSWWGDWWEGSTEFCFRCQVMRRGPLQRVGFILKHLFLAAKLASLILSLAENSESIDQSGIGVYVTQNR